MFDEDEKDQLFIAARQLGHKDFSERESRRLRSERQQYGVCAVCVNFQFAKTQYRMRHAKCFAMEFALSSADPITECTSYEEKGRMSLRDMADIAKIIELPKRKGPVGFEKKGRGGGEEDGKD